ncbi:MAG: hypothetical protein KDC84_02100 [Crocinitomicaceae bacterium]|nr:hypothetical protein [Crocinitomicaceae bacterium]
MIISNFAFDKSLFVKEIHKAKNMLSQTEIVLLQVWCYREFGKSFKKELDLVFIPNS